MLQGRLQGQCEAGRETDVKPLGTFLSSGESIVGNYGRMGVGGPPTAQGCAPKNTQARRQAVTGQSVS